jgi:hypothetical protein
MTSEDELDIYVAWSMRGLCLAVYVVQYSWQMKNINFVTPRSADDLSPRLGEMARGDAG